MKCSSASLNNSAKEIRAGRFVVTLHAVEELEDEGLSVQDIEHAILTGKIIRRQKDVDTGEWKYLVSGQTLSREGTLSGRRTVLVTKVIEAVFRLTIGLVKTTFLNNGKESANYR